MLDGSLFPTSIGANPQLSIYGITAKLATGLAARAQATSIRMIALILCNRVSSDRCRLRLRFDSLHSSQGADNAKANDERHECQPSCRRRVRRIASGLARQASGAAAVTRQWARNDARQHAARAGQGRLGRRDAGDPRHSAAASKRRSRPRARSGTAPGIRSVPRSPRLPTPPSPRCRK
mgnify:CR=1 FL=1